METTNINYQISKTIRFGLSSKEKISIGGRKVYKSHQEFADLVQTSINRIKDECSKDDKRGQTLPLEEIRICLNMMSKFLSCWFNIKRQEGQIAFDKDYYKTLSRKIGFQGFWRKGNNVKMPQSRTISLSELEHKDNNKAIKEYITEYWINLAVKTNQIFSDTDDIIKQYEDAVKANLTNNRPNEVELKKAFLSLASLVLEILKPICNGQICFPKVAKLDITKDKDFIDFANDQKSRSDLLLKIEEIKEYFAENGATATYCIATLNPKAATTCNKKKDNRIQLPQIGLEDIITVYDNADDFWEMIEGLPADKKKEILNNTREPLLLRSLMFKYNPIPSILHYELAKQLAKKTRKDEADILDFIRGIGITKAPQKDYADEKENFNIEKYPLKIAFDFAWEGCARQIYHEDSNFPYVQCKNYLKERFGIDINHELFIVYSQLLELNALLSTLDNRKEFDNETATKALEIWNEVNAYFLKKEEKKEGEKQKKENSVIYYLKTIKGRIENKTTKEDTKYIKARNSIGQTRGFIKNKFNKYYSITNDYKIIACKLGRMYASMRDQITDAAGLNRISHFAYIVEDNNADKYLLLKDIADEKFEPNFCPNGYKTYYINTLTTAEIAKKLSEKHKMSERKRNNYDPKPTEEEKYEIAIREWKDAATQAAYNWHLNLENKELEEIKKEIDRKCYRLESKNISKDELSILVNRQNCLLLPIINQDLAKEVKSDSNQFTKDWNALFEKNSKWHFSPQIRISYRKPTPDYPMDRTGDKRYSRFQINGHFLCNYIPDNDYISSREQIENYRDDSKQKEAVENFNNLVTESRNDKFYVFGIDRGQNELATLCVIDNNGKIQGNFDIYTRKFNSETKQWEHTFVEKRHILDLSNLRVETTIVIDGKPEKKQVLVDQSTVKVKDKNTNQYVYQTKAQVKMQQSAYIRKMQYKMQTEPEVVINWYKENNTEEKIVDNLVDKENGEKGLVSFYGAAIVETKYVLAPIAEKIKEMLDNFCKLKQQKEKGENVKAQLDDLIELEQVANIKTGVVANMVGVIAFLLKQFDYNVYISLEDLSKINKVEKSGTTDAEIKYSKNEGRREISERYAGLGLYNFFETQLLRKLFKMQQENDCKPLVPAFRAQKNYDNIVDSVGKINNQFGCVYFVNADSTSKTCPVCGACNNKKFEPDMNKYPNAHKDENNNWVFRDKGNGDRIHCYCCGFDTANEYTENPLQYIKSGDDNAAYLISMSAIKAYELAKTLVDNK